MPSRCIEYICQCEREDKASEKNEVKLYRIDIGLIDENIAIEDKKIACSNASDLYFS